MFQQIGDCVHNDLYGLTSNVTIYIHEMYFFNADSTYN